MSRAFARIAFTESVKEAQRRNGARANGERLEAHPATRDALTPELARFIAKRDSFFMATASREGWPYVQHRGGPRSTSARSPSRISRATGNISASAISPRTTACICS